VKPGLCQEARHSNSASVGMLQQAFILCMKPNRSTSLKRQGASTSGVARRLSLRAVTASAMFGIIAPPDCTPGAIRTEYLVAARDIDRLLLSPGGIALVTGPSGGGKSTILRALACHGRERRRSRLVDSISEESLIAASGKSDAAIRPIVDLFDGSLHDALGWLARAGLAEASLFAKSFRSLSDGQKHRLMLAVSLAASPARHSTIIIDEFCSILDRLSARAIAESIGKWMRSERGKGGTRVRVPRIVLATAHTDLADHLLPDVVVHVPLEPGPPNPIRIVCAPHHATHRANEASVGGASRPGRQVGKSGDVPCSLLTKR